MITDKKILPQKSGSRTEKKESKILEFFEKCSWKNADDNDKSNPVVIIPNSSSIFPNLMRWK